MALGRLWGACACLAGAAAGRKKNAQEPRCSWRCLTIQYKSEPTHLLHDNFRMPFLLAFSTRVGSDKVAWLVPACQCVELGMARQQIGTPS